MSNRVDIGLSHFKQEQQTYSAQNHQLSKYACDVYKTPTDHDLHNRSTIILLT